VAYKVMAPEVAENRGLVARFLTEAQITAQLEHPNVVPVYAIQAEDDNGTLAYSMKLVEGATFRELLDASAVQRKGDGSVDEELRVDTLLDHFLKCCDAMEYAHEKGVVHRDLKPANLMVGPYHEVYVMDWGLAKLLNAHEEISTVDLDRGDGNATRVGAVMGTPAYMSPEQAAGKSHLVGPAADQYALGLILYEIFCCRRARPQLDIDDVLTWAEEGRIRKIRHAVSFHPISPEVEAIIARATAAAPDDRYETVGDLATDLRHYRANQAVSVLPDTTRRRIVRWFANHREATFRMMLSLVALVALVFGGAVTKAWVDASAAAEREQSLGQFLTAVGQTAGRIDKHFSDMEARVEGVALTAGSLLERGVPEEGPIYFSETFDDPEIGAPDIQRSPIYDYPALSTRWPDVFVPADQVYEDVEPRIRALLPIRHQLRRAHLLSRMKDGASAAEAERRWLEEEGPIGWFVLGLEDGVYLEIPGVKWDTKGFDARGRPWYTLGRDATLPVWGNPYREATTGIPLMPCSMAIHAEDGHLLGVAAMTTRFKFLIDSFMGMKDHAAVTETFLVDDAGRILVRSNDTLATHQLSEDELDDVTATPLFHHEELVGAIQRNHAGYLWVDDGATLLVYYRLAISGWSFVVEADGEVVIDGS